MKQCYEPPKLIDIYTTLYPTTEYTSSVHENTSSTDYMLGNKINLENVRRIEII